MSDARTQTEQMVVTSPYRDDPDSVRVHVIVRDCNYGSPMVVLAINDDDKPRLVPSVVLTAGEAYALARYLKEAADRQSALDVVASSK